MSRLRIAKTNAMRLLERLGIAYEALGYDPAIHSAAGVAQTLGIPVERVYKTLVVLVEPPPHSPLLVMVPGDQELDLRALARALGVKSTRMAPQREAERLTGLQVGGIGALALVDRPFTVLLASAARDHDWILVNGGRRGLNLRLAVDDLLAVTNARLVEV